MSVRIVLLVLLLAVAAPGVSRAPIAASNTPEHWRFTLPEGDPVAGESVFVRLRCQSCHKVPGRGFNEPDEAIGPDLTSATAALPAEYLAESLMNDERFLPHGMYRATYSRSDGSSRMGGFSEAMTVRELIDLVAFLKSIE